MDPCVIGSLKRLAESQERIVRVLEKMESNNALPEKCFVALGEDGKIDGVYLDKNSIPLWYQFVEEVPLSK